jgi:hypothetical protein
MITPDKQKPARAMRGLPALIALLSVTLASAAPNPADPAAGRDHWAFQPFSETRRGIDDFVDAQRDSANLNPAPPAGKRDLLRRTHFQLIGLPPSPEDLASFESDSRPDAFERVVDQLLASPQFGERWGRHWLDLARYADSNGLDENFLFREAWRYRNWVIDAMNADLPFDRFVLEQIAGDTLPFESIDQRDSQRIASGFMVIGPKVLLGVNPKLQRMDVADEQLDTIGQTFLGLTLGCARCHDHKFEPIPTADYYAMAGILTSTKVMERRYMLGQQRVMEHLVGLGENGDKLDAAYEKYWRELPKLRERAKRVKSGLDFIKKDDAKGLQSLIKKHANDVAKEAQNAKVAKAERIKAQQALLASLTEVIAKPIPIPARAMIPAEADSPADEAIRRAGEFDKLAEQVPRGFLQVVSRKNRPEIPKGKSGRTELGNWLTDVDTGAGRLAARVLANRIWHHLIGRGIVRTVDNFGRTGEAPTHPELLDLLATRLIDSGWSVKTVIREITLSRTFAMSSAHNDEALESDPDNRLLWRAHRRRLDPESLRDAILATAGQLDFAQLDSSVAYLGDQATAVGANKNRRRTDFPNRSVYLPVIRNDLPEVFEAFNFADPHATTGARAKTAAATQGLFMMNDKSVMDASEAAARRLLADASCDNDAARIDRMHETILVERPTSAERRTMQAFINSVEKQLTDANEAESQHRAWSMACHALMSLSRFQFLE